MKTNVLFTVEPVYREGMSGDALINAIRNVLPDADYVLKTGLGVDAAVRIDGIYQPVKFASFLAEMQDRLPIMRVTAVYNTPRIGYVGYYSYDCHDNRRGLEGRFYDYDRIVDANLESWQIMGSFTGTPSGEYCVYMPMRDKRIIRFLGCQECRKQGEQIDLDVDDCSGEWRCPRCGAFGTISIDERGDWHVKSWGDLTQEDAFPYYTLCGRDEEPEAPDWPEHMVSLMSPISVSSLDDSCSVESPVSCAISIAGSGTQSMP